MRGAAASATTSQDSAKQVVKDYRKAQDLNDPVVTAVLEQMQRDPRAAQERLKKSHIYDKIEKLVTAAIVECKLESRFIVHLFDLVARNESCVVADMSSLPLKKSSIDVAVYSNRTLKKGGKLKKKWVFAKKKEVSSPIIHTDDV
uniref:Ribosomal RNA-processing protein 8 n=1 Tax=Ditylenchus dipsaci TaxID=166011 RepID=A0A915DCG8_9BILA